MKKFVLMIPFILALLAAPSYAATFFVIAGPAGEVFTEETLDVTITIHNDASSTEMFLISQPLAAAPANTWASADKGSVSIPAYSNATFKISITPADDARAGDYRYEFTVKKEITGELISSEFQVSIKQRNAAGVVKPTISCSSCTGPYEITINVENVGTAKLRDAIIKVTHGENTAELSVGDMNVSQTRHLTTGGDATELKPGAYSFSFELVANGQSLDTKTVSFSVPEIRNITVAQKTDVSPWSRTITYTTRNLGNVPGNADIKADVQQSPLVSISYNKPPTVSGNQWSWTESLQPGQSSDVVYTEFYWPIPVIAFAIALVAVYSYLFMTSIGMRKFAEKKGNDWSVGISIKNRGPAVEGVIVRDIIPHHFALSGTFETLKPIARRMEAGTELIWRIGGVKRGEEKLLHYRLTSKAHFAASRLPSARLRATKKDKTVLSSSNMVSVTGDKGPPKLNVEK